jgi:hypothetical protein
MKKIVLAALTVLSLGAGVANAQSYSHGMAPQSTAHQGVSDNSLGR